MKKTRLNRVLAFVLALMLLIGGSALTIGAESGSGMNGSVTNKTLAEIKEQLNAGCHGGGRLRGAVHPEHGHGDLDAECAVHGEIQHRN